MDIGLIGMGLLGKAMAARWIAAGHRVLGFDRREQAMDEARALSVDVQSSACAVARSTQCIVLSLMTSEDRRALLWGDQAMAAAIEPGTRLLDTTTARPEDLAEDAARLSPSDVRLVDVCVSGSSQTAANGQAVALIGDAEENVADYAPIIDAFCKARFCFGTPGRGNQAKLIVNCVFGLHRLVLAEALGLADAAGFDLGAILDVLKTGDTYSKVMDTKGPKMVQGVYEPPVARLAQHAKDVDLILEHARHLGASMPVSELHEQIIRRLVDDGYGHLDNAAIFKAYRS